jgi:hypothetical protein
MVNEVYRAQRASNREKEKKLNAEFIYVLTLCLLTNFFLGSEDDNNKGSPH